MGYKLVNGIAQHTRYNAQRPRPLPAAQVPCNAECGLGTNINLPGFEQHYRILPGNIGMVGQQLFPRYRLQSRKPEPPGRVVVNYERHGKIAEGTNSVEKDDWVHRLMFNVEQRNDKQNFKTGRFLLAMQADLSALKISGQVVVFRSLKLFGWGLGVSFDPSPETFFRRQFV